MEDTTQWTNTDKKQCVGGFLQRQAESIENVPAKAKSRNVYMSPRTNFSKHVNSQSPKFDKIKSKLGIRQGSIKLTDTQAQKFALRDQIKQ